MTQICVLGAGSWGTAFSLVLADAGNDVTLWARREEVVRHHQPAPREHRLPPRRRAAAAASRRPTTPSGRSTDAEVVVFAVPSQTFRANLERVGALHPRRRGDGLADEGRRARHAQADERGDRRGDRRRHRSGSRWSAGPTSPTRSRSASRPPPWSPAPTRTSPAGCSDLVHSPAFRPYTSVDVVGCELGGAYKNVVALSVGMAVGLGFGDNTTASVITRGLAETARLAMALGANPLTLMGLAGLGDLVATCSSPLSRNRTFGEKLGPGMTTEEIVASTRQVAEGAKSCSSLLALAEPGRRRRPDRRARRGRRRRADDRARDDGGVHRPGHQGRDGLTSSREARAGLRGVSQVERARDRAARSRQACRDHCYNDGLSPSSACTQVGPEVLDVLDADREPDQPSGMVAGSDFHRRRRSKVDSTPPSEVACTHSEVERASRSAASAPSGEHDRRRCRRSRGSGPRRPPGARPAGGPARWRWLWARSTPQVQGAQAAQGEPGLEACRGSRRCRSRRPFSTSYSWSSRGDDRAQERRRCGRRGTWWPSARRGRRPASSGRCSSGVAKVLSTTT